MGSWQVQDAKARFSEFLDATIEKGPQVVTHDGGLRRPCWFPLMSGAGYGREPART